MSRYEVVYDVPELAPWMIVDTTDSSVVDRYDTEEEALAILPQYDAEDEDAGYDTGNPESPGRDWTDVKYPHIDVTLTGEDGNAFMVMGRVTRALRQAGVPGEEIKTFQTTCMSGDYNHLLMTCMEWVNVS